MAGLRLKGLYAITDGGPTTGNLTRQVEQAIAGGARIIQYRDKTTDAARRLAEACDLLTCCRARGIPLIINDDITLAARVGADGVHLGKDDPALASARAELGPRAVIGVSCYNRFELAVEAKAAGADYVAFGSFFLSDTKPEAVRAEPGLLIRAQRELGLPTVAIGGISPENGRALIEAGADMLAVIRGVFARPDIRAAARAYADLYAADTLEEDHEDRPS